MTMDDSGRDPDGSEQDARIDSLEQGLRKARHAEAVRTGKLRAKRPKGYSQGNRVLAELIAGIAGGALIGWLFDRWLGTSPWGLLVLMLLGTAVAFRNIIRISNERPD
jgi:ATP synthase protein I